MNKLIAKNPTAKHNYNINDTLEAGIVLTGTEIKSIRNGKVNLKDSYASIKNNEIYIYQLHISPYEQGNIFNKDPLRERKLLLNKREIYRLIGLTKQKGYTLVPISLYFKNNFVKVELGIAKGKKLYEYARKGEEVEIQPRNVNISELELLNYDKENRTLELYIKCSKGTYIRSIAHDLGKNLNCFGHLIKLVRVKAGDFLVENAIKLDELSSVEEVKKHLIYPLEKLDYQTYELNEKELELVSHGMQIWAQNLLEEGIVILTHNSKLVAVAEANENKIKCLKVFI